jgi:hypothetical protein
MKRTFKKVESGAIVCTEVIDDVVVNERVVTSEQERLNAENLKAQVELLRAAALDAESAIKEIEALEAESMQETVAGDN